MKTDSLKTKLRVAGEMLNGAIGVINRKINYVQLFATNRCNSRCKICNIWSECPKNDLPLSAIESLLEAKVINKNASWSLVGGEFILHPEYDKILELFNEKRRNYAVFSNGIMVDRLVEAVKGFEIPKVLLSLDGPKETYLNVRGVDAHDKVIRAIEELKDITNLSVTYTINPLNSVEDFKYVKGVVEKHGIEIGVVVYDTREIFHTQIKDQKLYDLDGVFKSRYLDSYKMWKEKNMRIPCFSIRTNATIMPNGDVLLCQFKNVVLGNIHKNSIDEIWKSSKAIQDKYKSCSCCWVSCYKGFDNILCRAINTIAPEFVSKRIIGDFDWEKIGKI